MKSDCSHSKTCSYDISSKMASYDTVPSSAEAGALTPFTIDVPDTELERMKALLRLSRVAGPCYENSLPDGTRDLGLRREWLVEAKRLWEDEFDC